MPLNYQDLIGGFANQFQQNPLAPPVSPFGALGGGSPDIGAWRNLPSAPMDFNAMAGGLSGAAYQPPVRDVRFGGPRFGVAPSEPAVGNLLGDGAGGIVGGTVGQVGNPINAADNFAADLSPSYVDSSGFDSGGVNYNPPVASPVDASLSGAGNAIGNLWDYISTNGGNPYAPITGNMNDPNYNRDWSTTGDRGGVGNQLAGLLNMDVIGGGGGIGNNTVNQNLGGQAFAPDLLSGGIGDGHQIADLEYLLSRFGAL